jgi:hypothetical protein
MSACAREVEGGWWAAGGGDGESFTVDVIVVQQQEGTSVWCLLQLRNWIPFNHNPSTDQSVQRAAGPLMFRMTFRMTLQHYHTPPFPQ